jgi:hypothetical protein
VQLINAGIYQVVTGTVFTIVDGGIGDSEFGEIGDGRNVPYQHPRFTLSIGFRNRAHHQAKTVCVLHFPVYPCVGLAGQRARNSRAESIIWVGLPFIT